ncbi:MAG: DUF1501 domain-containing protein [Gemmataceae bacterium]
MKNTLCPRNEHLSRRAFLKGTLATTAGGVFLNWGGLFSNTAHAAQVAKDQKHCILIWLNGGCSQFETFDMKPGRPTGGPFRPIATKLPGVHICELMPRIAEQMDKIAVIRSMRTSEVDHPGGIYLMHTGYRPTANVRYPEIGAIVAKYHGQEGTDLPTFVKVSSNGNAGSGFLGPQYQPFHLGQDGRLPPFSFSNLDPAKEARRNELRAFLDEHYGQLHPVETNRMHQEAYESARRLQKTREVFNIDKEWDKYCNLYGESNIGRSCLLARRLVEAGVPFVEVGQSGYDTHSDNFTGHKGLVPPMDQAWAGLIVDLEQRGLLQNTLIVWMGEIGRTPNINNRAGRDHYVRAWSTALTGGGIKGGVVYGETDADGRDIKDGLVTEGDFFATIYQSLGINPKKEHYQGLRPIPVAPFGSNVVQDLLA